GGGARSGAAGAELAGRGMAAAEDARRLVAGGVGEAGGAGRHRLRHPYGRSIFVMKRKRRVRWTSPPASGPEWTGPQGTARREGASCGPAHLSITVMGGCTSSALARQLWRTA